MARPIKVSLYVRPAPPPAPAGITGYGEDAAYTTSEDWINPDRGW